MKTSCIIPTRDRRDLVTRAIAGVHAQQGPRPEIIVVDDGSIDNTAELVADRYPFGFAGPEATVRRSLHQGSICHRQGLAGIRQTVANVRTTLAGCSKGSPADLRRFDDLRDWLDKKIGTGPRSRNGIGRCGPRIWCEPGRIRKSWQPAREIWGDPAGTGDGNSGAGHT